MAMNTERDARMALIVEKELKELIVKLAKEESRSANGFITNAIKEYLKNNYPDISYK